MGEWTYRFTQQSVKQDERELLWRRSTYCHRVQTGSGVSPASYPVDTGAFSLRMKRPVCEVDHSPPSSAEAKKP